jgi:hypothetical protein
MFFALSIAGILGGGVIIGILWGGGYGKDAVRSVSSALGVGVVPDKLGWMDDTELSESDRRRVAEISGRGFGDNLSVIRSMQSLSRSNVTAEDFELLRQDRRRARAAYPDVSDDDLLVGTWLQVDFPARVPVSFCTSGNSSGTQGPDGKWYLYGGCYVSVVNPQYTERASAQATKAFFEAEKKRERAGKLARLREDGPFVSWSGTGGSMTVSYDKETKLVTVTRAKEWADTAQQWVMPFVVEEWVDVSYGDLDAIKKLPSFARAIESEISVQPSGVTMTVGDSGSGYSTTSQGFILMPGESATIGISATVPREHQ